MERRHVVLMAVPVVVFVAVTFGLRPTVNLIARLKSPHSYSQYGMSGTWLPGLIAAVLAALIAVLVNRRRG